MEWSCSFVFQPFYHHQNATIMGLVCCVLAGEGRGNLQTYCPQFCGNQTLCRYPYLYSWDPAEHLRFINPCNFRTLDRFKCTCLTTYTAADIWNGLPADIILQGGASGWHTILKVVQRYICTWPVQPYRMCMRFITVIKKELAGSLLVFLKILFRTFYTWYFLKINQFENFHYNGTYWNQFTEVYVQVRMYNA